MDIPLVAMQLFALGGVAYETEQTNGLSRLASLLVPRGTETRSAEEIARFFDARGGYLGGASVGDHQVAQIDKGDPDCDLVVLELAFDGQGLAVQFLGPRDVIQMGHGQGPIAVQGPEIGRVFGNGGEPRFFSGGKS